MSNDKLGICICGHEEKEHIHDFETYACKICIEGCFEGYTPKDGWPDWVYVAVDAKAEPQITRLLETIAKLDKIFYSVPQPSFLIEKWEAAKNDNYSNKKEEQ